MDDDGMVDQYFVQQMMDRYDDVHDII